MKSLGRDRDEFIGKHIKDALTEVFFENGKPYYDRVLNGERVDYVNKASFGDEVTEIVVSLIPRENHLGEVDSFFILATKKLI